MVDRRLAQARTSSLTQLTVKCTACGLRDLCGCDAVALEDSKVCVVSIRPRWRRW